MLNSLHRFIDASKAFKTVLIHGPSNDLDLDENPVTQSGEDNNYQLAHEPENGDTAIYSLKDIGHFADGTPLDDQSWQSWLALTSAEQSRRNSEHLQQSVLKWDKCVKKVIAQGDNRDYYFVFFHIPKSGGTTLKYIIAKNCPPNQFIHVHAPELVKNPSLLFNPVDQAPKRVIMGHHSISSILYQFLNNLPIVHFTLLRHPVERAISHFNFIKTRATHSLHQQAKTWTFDDYVESAIKEVQNGQALRILGDRTDDARRQAVENPDAMFMKAKQVLEEEFTFFGLTERYDEFLIMAKQLLNWQDIVYLPKNVSKHNEESSRIIDAFTPSEAALQKIRECNQLDMELYEFAYELFNQRCDDMEIDTTTVKQYKQLNTEYQSIMERITVS